MCPLSCFVCLLLRWQLFIGYWVVLIEFLRFVWAYLFYLIWLCCLIWVLLVGLLILADWVAFAVGGFLFVVVIRLKCVFCLLFGVLGYAFDVLFVFELVFGFYCVFCSGWCLVCLFWFGCLLGLLLILVWGLSVDRVFIDCVVIWFVCCFYFGLVSLGCFTCWFVLILLIVNSGFGFCGGGFAVCGC